MSELHRLVQERSLTWRDKSRILTARKKARLGGNTRPPKVQHNDAMPETSSAARLDCVVCLEGLGPNNAPQRRITSTCDHEPNVCLSCLTQSIATQFTSKVWDQIDCPSCSARLDHQDVQAFAEAEVFGRYDNHALEGFLSSAQFQRCRHPNCHSGQQCYPEHDSFIICQECQGRTCITCDILAPRRILCRYSCKAQRGTRRARARRACRF